MILDIRTGRFHSLNTSSAVVWETLKQNPNGVDLAQIVHVMTGLFGPQSRMIDDLEELMRTLERSGLVHRHSIGRRRENHGPPKSLELHWRPNEDKTAVGAMARGFSATTEVTRSRGIGLWTCAAWLCFMSVSLILSIGGFFRLHQTLRWLSTKRRSGMVSNEKISTVCSAVNTAATYYWRQSWCLHRAAVTFLLLRLAGMPAEFVIGCQRLPFVSHAWVEVHQGVVNDKARVKSLYPELDRI